MASLRDAAAESLSNLLSITANIHQRRRAAALQAFEDWLAEANTFRSVFEPADNALREGYDDRNLIGGLASLVAYLSRHPEFGPAPILNDSPAWNQRTLVLSPGEIIGLLAILQGFAGTDVSVSGREYGIAFSEQLHMAFYEVAQQPLIQTDLARLQQRIATFDPFAEPLVGPPSESLRFEMRNHVLPNGNRSPWLRQFLEQFEEPRWWSDPIRLGSARDPAYIQALAFSAHSTIVRQLITENPRVGELWDEYLERLFRERWLRPLRGAIARGDSLPWTRERFITVMAAVRARLGRDGYRLSIGNQALGEIWDSALDE
jgi:hypothetical protein